MQLQTKVLRRPASPEEYRLYRAGLEWDLVDPIVIESRKDLKSEPTWRGKLEPYHHQVSNLITFCRRLPVTLLADDVGLGKTISAGLVASELISRARVTRILIVCPKLLGPQWREELETKFGFAAVVVTGRALIDAEPIGTAAVITTYHSARMYLDRIPADRFQMLVLDEAHKLRNLYGTNTPPQVAKCFYGALAERRFPFVLMLTATPIQNRLWDLYSLVDLLTVARGHKNPFGTEGVFVRKFIADGRTQARKLKAEAQEEFRSIVYSYMSRVRRGDAKLYFPDRVVQLHRVKPTAGEIALIGLVAKGIERLNRLAQISVLQALASSPDALSSQLSNMARRGTVPAQLAQTEGAMGRVSGSTLYDLTRCSHKVYMDTHAPSDIKGPVDELTRLLWEHGVAHERRTIDQWQGELVDLSHLEAANKEEATRRAIEQGAALIYAGRLSHGAMAGEPDLIRRADGGYQAGDIKSGAAEASTGEGYAIKEGYALQLCLYTALLERAGVSDGKREAFIIDRAGQETRYQLSAYPTAAARLTTWERYEQALKEATGIVDGILETRPALTRHCRQCPWSAVCIDRLTIEDDLTLIPELGRATRDAMIERIPTVTKLASISLDELLPNGKSPFKGIGVESLRKFHRRSQLLATPGRNAYLLELVHLPAASVEVFFDIEDDPLNDHCYLHGFAIRTAGQPPDYFGFFADEADAESERKAFRDAWDLVRGLPAEAPIYFYSPHERTWWRKLQLRHSDVCTVEEVEALFDGRATDLYSDIVRRATEWPTHDYSVKSVAKYLGFKWRDENPSGAASIAWYQDWLKTKNETVKRRILDYNEDDCKAMAAVVDGIRSLKVGAG